MISIKDLLTEHLEHTFEKEAWQPPLATAVWGLTAGQAAWKPAPERHSIWQIVRHVIHWKRGVLSAWDGEPPDFEQLTRDDWPEAAGDQAAWEADVRTLHDLYAEFHRRLTALDDAGLEQALRWYRQATRPQPVARRLLHAFTHDIYHAGQIQYLRALQGIPSDRFFKAAWDGDVARLREALEEHPDLLNAHNGDGWTALQIASYAGQPDAVRFLLERGVDFRATSQNTMANTALHGATAGWQAAKRAEIVALLLDHGADPQATDAAGNTALHAAAHAGASDVIELLVQRGGDVNARRHDGNTPLSVALAEGREAAAELLRGHGAVE